MYNWLSIGGGISNDNIDVVSKSSTSKIFFPTIIWYFASSSSKQRPWAKHKPFLLEWWHLPLTHRDKELLFFHVFPGVLSSLAKNIEDILSGKQMETICNTKLPEPIWQAWHLFTNLIFFCKVPVFIGNHDVFLQFESCCNLFIFRSQICAVTTSRSIKLNYNIFWFIKNNRNEFFWY